jgi:hypothetical protein
MCLLTFNFCVCSAKNTVRYLVIHQTAFYTVGSTKKLSLKRSFCEAVFTCFFNWVYNAVCFYVSKTLLKNFELFIYFLLYFKLIFFYVFRSIWYVDIKNNFKKNKKKIILMHFQVKNTLKSNRNHTSKHKCCQIFYTCFLLHINLNHNFYQIHI